MGKSISMSAALFRTSTAARSALRAGAPKKAAAMASTSFVRGKATLPDLPYDYGALEPSISGKIMELHHKNHHQTYVNSFNAATEQLQAAEHKQDIAAQIALQPLINFHGGGHINHTLFWENLAPSKNGGGGEPSGALKTAIESSYGISPPSRPSSTQPLQVSKVVDGHGLSRTTRLDRFRSAHMPTRTRLLESTHHCWVLMLGSTHTTCNTRTERLSTSVLSGM